MLRQDSIAGTRRLIRDTKGIAYMKLTRMRMNTDPHSYPRKTPVKMNIQVRANIVLMWQRQASLRNSKRP